MPVDEKTAQSLAEKLVTFAEGLSPDEQKGLTAVVDTAASSILHSRSQIEADPSIDPKPEFSTLAEIHNSLGTEADSSVFIEQSTPWTTTITVLASHHIIGCGGGHDNSGAIASIQAEIDKEQAQIDRERDRLGGVGPKQKLEIEQEIREREAAVASLERQLSQLGH